MFEGPIRKGEGAGLLIDIESPSDTCFESFLSLIYASELAPYMMRPGLSLQYAQ